MESISADILRGLYRSPRWWTLTHGSWCDRSWEMRCSFIRVSNNKACAGKPQCCRMQDKRPGVIIMQFCIFTSLCCVESTTYKKAEAVSGGIKEISSHYIFFLLCYKVTDHSHHPKSSFKEFMWCVFGTNTDSHLPTYKININILPFLNHLLGKKIDPKTLLYH